MNLSKLKALIDDCIAWLAEVVPPNRQGDHQYINIIRFLCTIRDRRTPDEEDWERLIEKHRANLLYESKRGGNP